MSDREMDGFEQALGEALQRVEAPEGFAARVMERAAAPAEGGKKLLMMRARHGLGHGRAWVGGAIAAVLVLGVFGAEQVHVRREREKAEVATQQFEAATRITDQALRQTREQLAKAGVSLE